MPVGQPALVWPAAAKSQLLAPGSHDVCRLRLLAYIEKVSASTGI
jgi:hypothetical protein